MSDAEEEDPNQPQRSGNGGQIRLEDLEPGALSPSRASAGRARVPHLHLADEAVTARSSGGGASSREGKNAAIDVWALWYILRCDKARN